MIRPSVLFLSCTAFVFGSLLASAAELGSPVVGAVDLRSAELKEVPSGGEGRNAPAARRVISASLLSDELLHGILPWESWAGVSYVVDWASATPLAGSFPEAIARTSGKTEDLLTRAADLVVLSPYNNALTAVQLKNAGQETLVLKTARTFKELFSEYRRLGARVGRTKEVEVRISEIERELRSMGASVPRSEVRPRALLLQGMFSYGRGTLTDECLGRAGFENVLTARDFGTNPQLNVEHVLGLDPEVVIIAGGVNEVRRAQFEDLNGEVAWKELGAFREGNVFVMPGVEMSSISHHAISSCRAFARVRKAFDQ